MNSSDDNALEALELRLLFEGIYLHYGLDFRDYALASIRRRVRQAAKAESAHTVSELQDKVLHDPECMERVLVALTVHVTAMFRDPGFYLAFRQKVVPVLKTYPFVRIWHVGCSSGEEVYSTAILLQEEGIYDRCRIYATDMSEVVLRKAQAGVFPLSEMQEYTDNYQKSGGMASFSEYYSAGYDRALFRPSLRKHTVFAQHNLTRDASFNEFNVVLCRNVMIYFNKALQDRVHDLLYGSLIRLGVLCLGKKESIRFSPRAASYDDLDGDEKIYRRVT